MNKTIYIDADCKCHVSNPDGIYTEVEAPDLFNGKCDAYIEGFRVRPEGYTYTRDDGNVFGPEGLGVSPWRDATILEEFQTQYEQQQQTNNQYEAALAEIEAALGV